MRSIPRWVKYWLAWTLAGFFYISQDFLTRVSLNESISWTSIIVSWMAAMYVCAVFTPLILWLGSRWPIEGTQRWRPAALHVGCAVIFALVSTALEVPVIIRFGVFPRSMPFGTAFWRLLPYDLHGAVLRYFAVIALQALFHMQDQARRREREALELKVHTSELSEQLTAAQLRTLKMQLHPHFLFNTLSAIMVLVRQQKGREAETMLGRLSDLLRHTLDEVDSQEVPLWRELDFLQLYLSIEQVRFEDRLRIRISAAPDVAEAMVPHMALQPIVENAIRHGLGQSEQPVLIHVSAVRANGSLALTVVDDGPGCRESGFDGKGIGLANTRNRLKRLYGAEATLHAENLSPRGVQVTITLPYRTGQLEGEECA